jgi:hypothetical protein
MTSREDFTLPAELLERVNKQGFDLLPKDSGTMWRAVPGNAVRRKYTAKEHAHSTLLAATVHCGGCFRKR